MAEDRRAISPPLPPDPSRSSKQVSPHENVRRASQQARSFDSQQLEDSRPRSAFSSRHGSRTSSRPRPILHQSQPIYDAVDKAFSESISQAPADPHIDSSLVDKIATLVAEKLLKQELSASQSSLPHPPPLAPQVQPHQSPTQSSVASFANRYTPPASPTTDRGRVASSDVGSSERIMPDGDFDELEDRHIRDAPTPTPLSYTTSSAGRSSRAASGAEPLYKTASNISQKRVDSLASSPVSCDWDDATVVERAWEPLFDKHGEPQPRLGHFLRGIALHLIEDYEPKDSLVLTPAKMQHFFEETWVADEQYPWKTIFGQISYTSLSTIYQRLLAEHHLVQISNQNSPSVPALTPRGFQTLMTCLIQAHPNHEFERLSEAAKHMPICSAEDRKFRFPKELSRRLLPQKSNVHAAQRLTASMAHEPIIQLKNPTTMPPPPPPPPSGSSPPQDTTTISPVAQIPERKRQPYSRRANSSAFEDEDLVTPSMPIERERKPYTAREGSGKSYESPPDRLPYARAEDGPARSVRENSGSSAHSASNSYATRTRIATGPGTAPPVSYHNNNTFPRDHGSSYARSDSGGFGDGGGMRPQRANSDIDDGDRRYSRRQNGASPPMDDPRGRPIPSRPGQSNFPPQLPPLGTSFPNQRSQPLYDERRRSAYSAVPAPGSADDYGPFRSGSFPTGPGGPR